MKLPGKNTLFSEKTLNQLQFLCLCMAGAAIFLLLISATGTNYITVYSPFAVLGACIVFCAVSWIQLRANHGQYPARLSLLMVVWFLFSQLMHFVEGHFSHHYVWFLPIYLLAFPFAAITHDSDRQTGLKMLCAFYLSAFLIWVFYTVLLLFGRLPLSMQSSVLWDGTRLLIFSHPNNCSRGFMIGTALSLGFSFKTSRSWLKYLLLTIAALMFVCLSLTNSRSAILATSLLIGGIAFSRVYKGKWTQLVVGMVLAFAITVTLFFTAQGIFQRNSRWLMLNSTGMQNTASSAPLLDDTVTLSAKPMQKPSAIESSPVQLSAVSSDAAPAAKGTSPQGTLSRDIGTFNNRTKIWKLTLETALETPTILLWGTHTTRMMLGKVSVAHSHNAWLDVLLKMGLPGFIISLIFTWQALVSAATLLFSQQVDLWKKTICLLVLAFLLSGVFESNLFFPSLSSSFIDFLFFFCLGYMREWMQQLRAGSFQPDK